MKHVFIVGSKGIPAQYGGFETFVERLTAGKQSPEIRYHVSCMNNDEKNFEYNNADCFNVRVPVPGAPGRIFHVGLVLKYVEKWVKCHPDEQVIVYILGCRIGPLLIPHSKRLHRLGVEIFCNPDGLEWKREKWGVVAKRFLKYCESCLVLNSDLVICDSANIEKYIQDMYRFRTPKTTFIAYGADVSCAFGRTDDYKKWCEAHEVVEGNYYLIVGRFVPENNYETMITEYMHSDTDKDLVIITNVEKNKFYDYLLKKTGFEKDKRIKFVGTVYDEKLLKMIRENAHGYLHGHEVGGTNPSLLEALASTNVNLLLDVCFNKEVAETSALYWNKENNNLASLLEKVDKMNRDEIERMGVDSKLRINSAYNWKDICGAYEKVFMR